ncbi:MAG: hypothetical protein C0404_11510 [Verrucomicrobia bacterium]|nr:hypothetical protein [Verrucomicrobiota bacterium]
MKNEDCVKRVDAAIRGLPGIRKDDTNGIVFLDRKVIIKYDSLSIAHKNMEHAIADAGFAANSIPANKDARDKLPPECK